MKVDIISGFLGAGKTTFIKRLLATKLACEKVVLIENEFGEVSVDSDFLSDYKIDIQELSQGCICCSLFGDFTKSLNEVVSKYNPDRIIIEPSGVGKLSDVVNAVSEAGLKDSINSLVCLVDAKKAKMYEKNFGEFFKDQIKTAHTIVLSRTDVASQEKIDEALEIVRSLNDEAVVITTPIVNLSDEQLFKAYEGVRVDFVDELLEELNEHHHDEDEECSCHHHHHHDEEEECSCHHHHHDEDEECSCHHHHHDEDEECSCHHHHHDEDEECSCHHHHHDEDEECSCHHHHHHADEVFTSIGIETAKKYDIDKLKELLEDMSKCKYGLVVRAKGIICGIDNKWYQFNLTIEEVEVETIESIAIGKICVIGSKLDEELIKSLF